MKLAGDALGIRLERALGAGSVTSDPAARAGCSIDGVTPALIVFPAGAEEVGAVLGVCSEAGAAVAPRGGGTAIALGNVPRRADVVVDLKKIGRLIEHDDANLTATAEAGMAVGSFQQILGERRQFLAADPPHPARATLGGVVSANSNGPRRMMHGGVRDLVIGMKMVLATGERIKAGGKVVKNVAGYDLCKLFVGSLGTLGIVTEATFRVAPLAERAASFAAAGPLERCARFSAALLRSPLLPSAVAIIQGAAADIPGAGKNPALAVRVEGFEEAVARHLRDLAALAADAGLEGEVLGGAAHERLWDGIRDFGWGERGVLCRLTVPAGSVAELSAALDGARYVAHAGAGAIWALLDAEAASLARFASLAALARQHRGHAIIAAAPADLKAGIDVWGEAPPGLELMREIKRQFDPGDILNPGRFIGGI